MPTAPRVLIVEDNDAIRDLVAEVLRDAGYDVDEARGGREGLDLAARVRPDVILLDRLMPDGNGDEFVRDYRASAPPYASIVALCAARDAAEWARLIDADACISKPFDIDDLLRTVGAHVARSDRAASGER